nr:MAG TPA: hypothetical protein [Caudoviricetes sp.]
MTHRSNNFSKLARCKEYAFICVQKSNFISYDQLSCQNTKSMYKTRKIKIRRMRKSKLKNTFF